MDNFTLFSENANAHVYKTVRLGNYYSTSSQCQWQSNYYGFISAVTGCLERSASSGYDCENKTKFQYKSKTPPLECSILACYANRTDPNQAIRFPEKFSSMLKLENRAWMWKVEGESTRCDAKFEKPVMTD
jgi:hypothetical protein